jgi:hypothetical protein
MALLLYVDDCTSQKTHLWSSTARYGDGFTFLYANDVRTSQETPIDLRGLLQGWLYFLYINNICTSQETHLWASAAYYGADITSVL